MAFFFRINWLCVRLIISFLLFLNLNESAKSQPELLAKIDCESQPEYIRPYLRYIWLDLKQSSSPEQLVMPWSDGKKPSAKAIDYQQTGVQKTSLLINLLSRSSLIIRPIPLKANDGTLILRINTGYYSNEPNVINSQWSEAWENLQFDPKFSLFITEGFLKTAQAFLPDWKGRIVHRKEVLVDVPEYVDKSGAKQKQKWLWKTVVAQNASIINLKAEDIQLIKILAPHVNQDAWNALVHMTGSEAPLVSYKYLLARSLQSIQEKNLYQTLYGGLYYQFTGLKDTEDDVLIDLKVSRKGEKAEDIYSKLASHQRVAMSRSGVTSRPRRIDFLRIPEGARLDQGIGLFAITQDHKKQSIDIDVHPLANLLKSKFDGKEAIFEAPNGLHRYILFNGDGKRVDEVPPDIAPDHTVRSPYGTRLQSAISCISCHETEGSDGWIAAPNHVKALTKVGIIPIAEFFTDKAKTVQNADALRLAELYQGESEKFLGRARDDYASAVLKATGPWVGSQKANADIIKLAMTSLVNDYRDYFEAPVDYKLELGDDFKKLQLLPIGSIEDFRIGLMLADPPLPVERPDFDMSYAFVRLRLMTFPKLGPPDKIKKK